MKPFPLKLLIRVQMQVTLQDVPTVTKLLIKKELKGDSGSAFMTAVIAKKITFKYL